MMNKKFTKKLACLIACLTMLIGSTFSVSAADAVPVSIDYRDGSIYQATGTTPVNGVYTYINPATTYTPDQVALILNAIDAAGVTNEMSAYQKCDAINNYVVAIMDYDMSTRPQNPTGDGVIALQLGGRGVCMEYADLFQTLCESVGITCWCVCGTATDELGTGAHAWNMVCIDGKYYYVDTCWNDPLGGDAENLHDYFMSETLWGNHYRAYRYDSFNEFAYKQMMGIKD